MKLSHGTSTRYGATLQIGKTAFAASLSWWLATQLSFNNYPYFAPIAAILTVQVTVADSLEKALQRTMGIILGVTVSLLIGHWLMVGTLTIFLVILAGMAISNALRLNNQITTQVAVTSLLVLAFGHSQGYASGRIIETIIGCTAAIGINALVIPPNAIPGAEASLFNLSKQAASTLNAFVLLFSKEGSRLNHSDQVDRLINETRKSIQNLQLAKQSLKFSPFLSKVSSRLEILTYGMNHLEKITVQIRGIRRSLIDLREMEDYRKEIPNLERIFEALQATAACIDHFGEAAIYASSENKGSHSKNIHRAQSIQLACLNELTQATPPHILREIGAILTDLNRIVQEVSSDE